ncbi:hypothetical protein EBU24_03185, partial [bacterium]|nr:hypothetical protein [bacterium]
SIVGIDTLGKSVREMVYDYEKKAYMSLDGLYSPVSIKGAGGYLPRYTEFSVGDHKSSPEAPFPPYAKGSGTEDPFISGLNQNNLEISQKYTNPLTNKFVEDGHHHEGQGQGHVIEVLGRSDKVLKDGLICNFYDLDDDKRYNEDYRFLALKGPLVLQSWGYDTTGKPIPNAADTESSTKEGKFVNENLQDKFSKDWLAKPYTWPVAPVDLRFDRQRGVWVSPPGYKIVVAKLLEDLDPYGSCKALLVIKNEAKNQEYGRPLYDKDGNEVKATENTENSEAKIKIVDRIGKTYKKDAIIYAYYDTYNSEYIILSNDAAETSIRFKLIDKCSGSSSEPNYGDGWTKLAGYNDKFPNNHILGVRIDCDGIPVDKDGNIISEADLDDTEKASNIYVNLYDNTGYHGPSYAKYTNFGEWKDKAFNGIAVSIVKPSGSQSQSSQSSSCSLGNTGQCSSPNSDYPSFDIVFLESYARFIECNLQQDLYVSSESNKYSNDEYKTSNKDGNAKAYLKNYYGNNVNGKEPKFYKSDGSEIEIRVFDPFFQDDIPKERNPFAKLKEGDKVLAIFDEKNKKYIIYQSIIGDLSKVIKFALVDDKTVQNNSVRAIEVNTNNQPIDKNGDIIQNQQDFNDNIILLNDTFRENAAFGPALGSANFNEHINGINLGDIDGGGSQNVSFPFIGFALKTESNSSSSSTSTKVVKYEIMVLEHFAKYVTGKICTLSKSYSGMFYLGVRDPALGYTNGRKPITRKTSTLVANNKANLILEYPPAQFYGTHSFILGDFIDQPNSNALYDDVDGCRFMAELDCARSNNDELIYNIIESEHVAIVGKVVMKDIESANELNTIGFTESDTKVGSYDQGFMWDKDKSKEHYDTIKIKNRDDWVKSGLIIPDPSVTYASLFLGSSYSSCILQVKLSEVDASTGKFTYTIISGGTIARFCEKTLTSENMPGVFGQKAFIQNSPNSIKIKDSDTFYHGSSPLTIPDEEKPIILVPDTQSYMTFEGSRVVGAWVENGNGGLISSQITAPQYRVIAAQEAPTIITGKAVAKFKPEDNKKDISIKADFFASSEGVDKNPVITLITKIENPMGYGAEADDIVTVQRVYSSSLVGDVANYKYIVIGTSSPPKK